MEQLQRILGPVDWLLRGVVALTLAFMMFLTFLDVLGREVLLAPVPAAFELTELAMGILIFSALPLLCARGQHVTVDLFEALYKGRIRRVRDMFVNLFGAIVLGVIAWRLWAQADRYAAIGEESMILSIPLAPMAYLLFGLSVISALAMAGRGVFLGADRASPPPAR